MKICALIVTYFPDSNFLSRLLRIAAQLDKTFVIDNTPSKEQHIKNDEITKKLNIDIIYNEINLGLAAALNQGLSFAEKEGFEWILTLDQDTTCNQDMVETLTNIAQTCPSKTLVIGSNYFDPRNLSSKLAAQSKKTYQEQKTVITSGSLIKIALATKMGGFRSDYFIDQVDHEFCLRGRKHGYLVIISTKPLMTHCVGENGGMTIPLFGTIPKHAPLRTYYVARNSLITISNYWRSDFFWCIRRLLRLFSGFLFTLFLETEKPEKIRLFLLGAYHALINKTGALREK